MGAFAGPEISTDGLLLCFDAASVRSSPGSGNTMFNIGTLPLQSNNATLVNGSAYYLENNGGILFDGTDDIATVTNVQLPTGSNSRTIIVAARCFEAGPSFQQLCSYGATNGFENNIYSIGYRNSGLDFAGYTNTPTYGTFYWANSTLIANTPYVLAMRYDETGVIKNSGFINGEYRAVGSPTSNDYTMNTGSTSTLRIGSRYDGTGFFKGIIYYIKFYNRALTDAEVKQDYNSFRGRFNI